MNAWTVKFLTAIVLPCSGLAATAGAGVLHVPADQPTIQQAIDAAVNGDTILVAPGSYVETIDYLGKRLAIVSDGGAAVTTIDATGAGSVVTARLGEPAGTALRGFTLTGGTGSALAEGPSALAGGGVFISSGAHLGLTDCVITGNTVNASPFPSWGGGVFADSGSVSLTDCTVSNNVAQEGGAIANGNFDAGAFSLQGCSITGNASVQRGDHSAVIRLPNGSLVASDCLIADNVGGGLWHTGYQIQLSRCDFVGNTGWGFGSYAPVGTSVSGCRFLGNGLGGALLEQGLVSSSDNFARHCVFAGGDTLKSTPGFDGTLVESCTFDGGRVVSSSMPVSVRNCIFRNVATPIVGGSVVDVTYSDVEGGWAGVGNIDADPLWVNAAAQDYHLAAGSPCIDAGDPSDQADPDGSQPDMGAFTYGSWADLGGGVAGSAGWPLLEGQGALAGGQDVGLQLTGAPAFKSTFLILGAAQLGASFKGGTLWPTLDLVVALVTNGAGSVSLTSTLPASLPSGLTLRAQFWFKDTGGPLGFAGSNGVRSPAP